MAHRQTNLSRTTIRVWCLYWNSEVNMPQYWFAIEPESINQKFRSKFVWRTMWWDGERSNIARCACDSCRSSYFNIRYSLNELAWQPILILIWDQHGSSSMHTHKVHSVRCPASDEYILFERERERDHRWTIYSQFYCIYFASSSLSLLFLLLFRLNEFISIIIRHRLSHAKGFIHIPKLSRDCGIWY